MNNRQQPENGKRVKQEGKLKRNRATGEKVTTDDTQSVVIEEGEVQDSRDHDEVIAPDGSPTPRQDPQPLY